MQKKTKKNEKHAKIAHAKYKIWQNIKYANRCKQVQKGKKCTEKICKISKICQKVQTVQNNAKHAKFAKCAKNAKKK